MFASRLERNNRCRPLLAWNLENICFATEPDCRIAWPCQTPEKETACAPLPPPWKSESIQFTSSIFPGRSQSAARLQKITAVIKRMSQPIPLPTYKTRLDVKNIRAYIYKKSTEVARTIGSVNQTARDIQRAPRKERSGTIRAARRFLEGWPSFQRRHHNPQVRPFDRERERCYPLCTDPPFYFFSACRQSAGTPGGVHRSGAFQCSRCRRWVAFIRAAVSRLAHQSLSASCFSTFQALAARWVELY